MKVRFQMKSGHWVARVPGGVAMVSPLPDGTHPVYKAAWACAASTDHCTSWKRAKSVLGAKRAAARRLREVLDG